MTDYGKVSIITPMHNAAGTVREAIESVLLQSYGNWEMIIADDCSADDSVSVVQSFADPRIVLLKNERNLGPGGTRNAGIRAASGRFLAFLDADDQWFPEKLERQLAFMKEHDAAFTCHGYQVCDETMQRVIAVYMPPERVRYRDVLTNNTIGCLSAVYDTEKVGKVYMPERRGTREDMVTWLEVLSKCGTGPENGQEGVCLSVGEVLARYRVSAGSVSGNKRKLVGQQYGMYRKELGLSVPAAALRTAQSVFNKLFRKY